MPADPRLLNTNNTENSLAAFQAGRDMGMEQRRQNALAGYGANPAGTRNALIGMGDTQTAGQLQGLEQQQVQQQRQQVQDQQQQEQYQQAQEDRHRQTALQSVASLRVLPPEQRAAAFMQRAAPALGQLGLPPEAIQHIAAEGLTDEELDSVIAEFGGELHPLQSINLGQGGVGTFNPNRYDPQNAFSVVREPAERPAPQGYAWGPEGNMVPIPGGPADPRTIGTQAEVRRQVTVRNPLPSRSGGKAGSSRSGARSAVVDLGSGTEPNWGN